MIVSAGEPLTNPSTKQKGARNVAGAVVGTSGLQGNM